jgi:transposase InsO family protein
MTRAGSLGCLGTRCSAVGSAEGRWVSDITFVPTRAGFLYLAVVLAARSRKIAGPPQVS